MLQKCNFSPAALSSLSPFESHDSPAAWGHTLPSMRHTTFTPHTFWEQNKAQKNNISGIQKSVKTLKQKYTQFWKQKFQQTEPKNFCRPNSKISTEPSHKKVHNFAHTEFRPPYQGIKKRYTYNVF